MDHLILKYLRGELSLEERHRLNKWLEEDASRRDMLVAFELYWQNSQYDFGDDKVEIFDKIRKQIKQKETPGSKRRSYTFTFLKYAAIFLLVSSLSILVYSTYQQKFAQNEVAVRHIEKTSMAGQNITIRLPDGSNVKLNAESKLIVPEVFQGGKREVELIGEAFFDIEPNPEKPFIIKISDMNIEVLGTSFNVSAYQDENQTVAVKTGLVKVVNTRSGNVVQLEPDEMSVMSNEDGKLFKRNIDDLEAVFGWIDRKIVFKDQNVFEVFKEIQRWYGIEIKIEKELSKLKPYTAQHDNPTIEEVLKSLSFVYEFQFKMENKNTLMIY